MVDAGQRTAMQVPADAVNAPGLGAHVIRKAPISWGHMQDAVSIDGQDRWLGQSLMTPVGCSTRELVLLMMLVSFSLHRRTTSLCCAHVGFFPCSRQYP